MAEFRPAESRRGPGDLGLRPQQDQQQGVHLLPNILHPTGEDLDFDEISFSKEISW